MKYVLTETDGGYGDLGTIPSAPNPAIKKKRKDREEDAVEACKKGKAKFKLKKSEEIDEVKGNRDPKDKKIAKFTAKARQKAAAKCGDSQSPHKVDNGGGKVRFVCKKKDKEKARKASKRMKKFNKTAQGKKAGKVRKATKDYRK